MGILDDLVDNAPPAGEPSALDRAVTQAPVARQTIGDYARKLQRGATSTFQTAPAQIASMLGAPRTAVEQSQRAEQTITERLSPAGRFVDSAPLVSEEGGLGPVPVQTVLSAAVESAPSLVQAFVAGKPIFDVLGRARVAERVAGAAQRAGVGARTAGVVGRAAEAVPFAAVEGVQAGAMAAADMGKRVRDLSDEKLRASPAFAEAYAATDPAASPESRLAAAREAIAQRAERQALAMTGASTGTIGMATGAGVIGQFARRLAGRQGAEAAADTLLKATLKGAGAEAAQETPQSGAEQLIANWIKQGLIDPNQPLTEGVLNAALTGGAAGGLLGGLGGGAGRLAQRTPEPEREPTLDEIIDSAPPAGETQGPIPGTTSAFDETLTPPVDPAAGPLSAGVAAGQESGAIATNAIGGPADPLPEPDPHEAALAQQQTQREAQARAQQAQREEKAADDESERLSKAAERITGALNRALTGLEQERESGNPEAIEHQQALVDLQRDRLASINERLNRLSRKAAGTETLDDADLGQRPGAARPGTDMAAAVLGGQSDDARRSDAPALPAPAGSGGAGVPAPEPSSGARDGTGDRTHQPDDAGRAGAVGQSLTPEIIDEGGADPTPPPGPRWWSDRGVMPGEPFAFLDMDEDSGPDTAIAAMREIEVPGRGVYYEVTDRDGNVLSAGSTPQEAAQLAEQRLAQPKGAPAEGQAPVDIAAAQSPSSPTNNLPAPTDAQKEAGNYPKPPVQISGLTIRIENEAGTRRAPEYPTMKAHYGYFQGTKASDEEGVDVFVRPGTPETYDGPVFVIDGLKRDGSYDEAKVMLGWEKKAGALASYRGSYEKGWKVGAVTQMTMAEFKAWLRDGDTTKALAAQPKPKRSREEVSRERKRAYREANPFKSFLAEYGINTADRADVGGDPRRPVLVPYHGALFRGTGMRLDELAWSAVEHGFLTQADIDSDLDNGGVNKLSDMIRRMLAGERILPVTAAESEQEAQWRADMDARYEAMQEAEDAIVEQASDDEINALLQLASDEDAEASNEEIDYIAGQERLGGETQEGAAGVAPRGDSRGGTEAWAENTAEVDEDADIPFDTEGEAATDDDFLASPTPDGLRAQADQAAAQMQTMTDAGIKVGDRVQFTVPGFLLSAGRTYTGTVIDSRGHPLVKIDGRMDFSARDGRVESRTNVAWDARWTKAEADPRNAPDAGFRVESPKAGYAFTQVRAVRAAIKGVKSYDEKQIAALVKWISKRPDSARIVANLKEHALTPWARQSLEGALTRAAIEEYAAGRTPEFDSFLNAPTAVGLRTLLEQAGADGAWQYLAREGVVGNSAKPVNSVSSSFIDCNPSKDCATFCYAAKGNFSYGSSVRKSELMTWAAENDPVRLGRLIAGEYAATLEFQHQKALRLFDKGDGTDAWLPVIEELNRHVGPDGKPEPIRVQVFSKNPDFLRKVPAMNLRMLSVDKSNVEVARANPDLPVAFVYTDASQAEFLNEIKDRIQVILPIKQGSKLLDQDKIDALPKWTKPVVCPVDDGRVKIGKNRFERTDDGSRLVTNKGEWNCTRCDKNGGVGCFHGSTTDKAIAAFTKPVHTRSDDEVNRILDDLRTVSGRLAPRERAEFLGSLDSLVSAIRAGIDIGTEGTGRAGDAARTGADDGWQAIRITRRQDVEEGGGVEAPRRKYGKQPNEAGYEADLFSGSLPEARGTDRPAESEVAGVRRNVQPAATLSDTEAPAGEYFLRTVLGTETNRQLGASVIKTHADAARATKYLYRNAVERFDGIVTDKNGKPLAVVGGFKGALSQASVYPATLVGEAIRVPGAARIWFSHNHPSGTAELSAEDQHLNASLARVFHGSGIEPMGILAVAGERYAFQGVTASGFTDHAQSNLPIEGKDERIDVPVVERMLAPDGVAGTQITSPTDAKTIGAIFYNRTKEPGLLLVSAQNRVVAWVPLPSNMIGKLRGTGGLRALYRSVSESTVGGALIVHGGELSAHPGFSGVSVVENIGAALKQVDVTPLDAINVVTGHSRAEHGASLASGPVFSRGTGAGMHEADVSRVADAVRARWANGPEVVVVADMNDTRIPEAVRREDARQRSGGAAGAPEGFFADGKVYIVASEIDSAADVVRVLLHEALGHYGLRGLYGNALNGVLDKVIEVRRAEVIAKMRAYGLPNTLDGRRTAAEEVLAGLAQTQPKLNIVRAAIAAIRSWLRKIGFRFAVTDADIIAQFIIPARAWVQRGGKPAMTGAVAFQRVWHGSPHRFKRFSTDSIGTGEGAQAYGWGLYFASLRAIAEHYRDTLSRRGGYPEFSKDGKTLSASWEIAQAYFKPGRVVRSHFGKDVVVAFERAGDGYGWNVKVQAVDKDGKPIAGERQRWHSTFPDFATLEETLAEDGYTVKRGGLYEVEIPEDGEFMLWDKPLSDQPDRVKQALAKWKDAPDKEVWGTGYWTGGRMYESNVSVRVSFDGMARSEAQRDVSLGLLKAGIRGIKYLDGNSRRGAGQSFNYVVFSENDTEIVAAFSRRAPDVTPLGFYSELARKVEAGPGRADAANWKSFIRSQKGVKPDEIAWTGIEEFLDLQQGKVTKDAVLDYLSENGVRVEETMLGDSGRAKFDTMTREQLGQEYERIVGYNPIDEDPDISRQDLHELLIGALQEQAESPGLTKFDRYRVPGRAENYRELLLTLPPPPKKTVFTLYEGGNYFGQYASREEAEAAKVSERRPLATAIEIAAPEDRSVFRTSHWDQPNVLAHIRMDERTDADGKRVLFINELQSDWGQRGRKEGFADGRREGVRYTAVRRGNWSPGDDSMGKWEVFADGVSAGFFKANSEDYAIAEALDQRERMNNRPPRAPFVENTSAWVALAIKRVIRYAVDNGFDRVAIVNGEQAAKMFDLSEHVTRLYYDRDGRGYILSADGRRGEVFPRDMQYSDEELDGVVGKEIAQKIRNREGREDDENGGMILEGVDLEVGGEGMEKFYPRSDLGPVGTDKNGKPIYPIVQLVAQKVLKQLGGPALTTVDIYTPARAPGAVNEQGIVIGPDGERSRMAEQPGFDITPAMREQARAGVPMFSRAGSMGQRASNVLRGLTVGDVMHRFGNRLRDLRGVSLQALGRRQIVDVYGDLLPQLRDYDDIAQQLEAEKNEGAAEADGLADRWGRLTDERALADVMHDATLAGWDPDTSRVPVGLMTPEMRNLLDRFNALTPQAKAVYRDARDAYRAHYEKVKNEITARIRRSIPASPMRAAMLEEMEATLFRDWEGVYFPLARFGDYVIVARDAGGNTVAVSRAESLNEAETVRAHMMRTLPASRGYTVGKILKSREFNAARDGVGRSFLHKLYGVLDQQGALGAELQDSINQLYLSSLPDLSWAKHGIHRKGTPGFSQDARRAFAQNMFHGARYLAKLRHSDRLADALMAMQEHVDAQAAVEDYDSVAGQQVVDEMAKRHEIFLNPKVNPWATAATSVGFVWYLGLSPASAVVNLSQTPLVAFPLMGAKWGFRKAASALQRASRETMAAGNDLSKRLQGAELDAFKRATKDGTIDITQAHDLAGIAQGEDQGVVWRMRPIMKAAAFMFHHAEKFNRQATFLAAYRLAKAANPAITEGEAYRQAKDITYRSHFDYAAGNKPRIMQGNVARVVLLFKQFAQNMIYTLARQGVLAAKGDRQAAKAFGALLTSHALAAGIFGLPLVNVLLEAASMLGSTDDEPWDAEGALRNYMAEAFGPTAGAAAAHGLSRLTPWDISGRVGLDHLIFPDVREGLEGESWAHAAAASAAGPVLNMALIGPAKGLSLIADGHWMRGLEAMLPAVLRSGLKSVRYATEGAQTRDGKTIVEDVGMAEWLGQAAGFSPSRVRDAGKAREIVFGLDRRINARRASLIRDYGDAVMAKDHGAMGRQREAVLRFNAANPDRPITGATIVQSVRMRTMRAAEAEKGIYLPRKRRGLVEQGRFADVE